MARIRAVEDEREQALSIRSPEANPRVLSHGDLQLDTECLSVSLLGDPEKVVELTATEYRLLRFLMNHACTVVSRNELIDGAYNGRVVSERTIDTHIWSLRRKLEKSRCHLQTVRGAGYSFV